MKLPANVCLFSNNNSSNKENLIAKSPGRVYWCCSREAVAVTDLVNKDTQSQSLYLRVPLPPYHLHHFFNQTNFRNVSDSYVNTCTGILVWNCFCSHNGQNVSPQPTLCRLWEKKNQWMNRSGWVKKKKKTNTVQLRNQLIPFSLKINIV